MTTTADITEALARALSAADVEINDGDYPTWDQISTTPGRGQDEYRKAARFLLERFSITERTTTANPQPEHWQFTDADGDLLHIGTPADPANGSAAVSFYTPTEPVHVPVERIPEVIDLLHRLAPQHPTA